MSEELTSDRILEIARGYWPARVILTAAELDIFDHLGDEPRTSDEVAAAAGTDPRATELLLNALTALGLLTKAQGQFANTRAANEYLFGSSPRSLWGPLHHNLYLWKRWSTLTEVMRTGEPVWRERPPEATESFIMAMHRFAQDRATTVLDHLELQGVYRVLDLGGGPGTYACEFARRSPTVRVTLMDLPDVIPIAQRVIAGDGLSDRIETRVGDYLADDYGEGYNLAFLSAIIHSNSPEEIGMLFRKTHAALAPGGRIVVQDFLMEDDKTTPLSGAIFAINMLVGTPGGATYSESEVRQWLAEAGFSEIERINTGLDASLMVGRA